MKVTDGRVTPVMVPLEAPLGYSPLFTKNNLFIATRSAGPL